MAKKLIFLSDNHRGSLKLNAFVLLLVLSVVGFGYSKFVPTLFERNGTSVIAPKTKSKGSQNYTTVLPNNLTSRQHELLNFAYKVAKADGIKHPEYLQGLILQESLAGGIKDFRVAGDRVNKQNQYFGIGQIKLAAAIDVMKSFPQMWDHLATRTHEELQARLILDDHFNIRVASKYLLLMGVNKASEFALTAYNRGIGGAMLVENHREFHYTDKVIDYANSKTIKNLNKSQKM